MAARVTLREEETLVSTERREGYLEGSDEMESDTLEFPNSSESKSIERCMHRPRASSFGCALVIR